MGSSKVDGPRRIEVTEVKIGTRTVKPAPVDGFFARGQFDRVVAQKSARADGALYWKAFAQARLVRVEDALARADSDES